MTGGSVGVMSRTSDPGAATNGHPTPAEEHALGRLSPFELKARLIAVATESARPQGIEMLDAGRGNPELDRHHTPRGVLPARAVRDR